MGKREKGWTDWSRVQTGLDRLAISRNEKMERRFMEKAESPIINPPIINQSALRGSRGCGELAVPLLHLFHLISR